MSLSPKQAKALKEATKRINLFEGCVRSGKTHVADLLFLEQIYTIPYDKFLLSGKTKESLNRNVTSDLIKIIGYDNCEYNSHLGELAYSVGKENRKVYCVGALDDRSMSRIQGSTFGGWYADERTVHPENFCEMARTRLSVPNSKIIWTCNPDSPYHPVYTDYILRRDSRKDLYHLHFELEDNPSLTEEFKKELCETFTGIFYRRMIKGEWVLAEGIIYDMFGAQHIIDEYPPMVRYFTSADYGTASTTVFLLFGVGEDGKIYVLKEWYHDAPKARYQLTDPELVEEHNRFIEDNKLYACYPDPSAASFNLELRKSGISARETNNDVLEGIRAVSKGFHQNTLLIHRSCKTLIEELSSSYVWDDRARLRGEDKPLKKNDHRSDTLRYGYYSYILNKFSGSSAVSAAAVSPLVNKLYRTNQDDEEVEDRRSRFFWRQNPNRLNIRNTSWLKRKRVPMQ